MSQTACPPAGGLLDGPFSDWSERIAREAAIAAHIEKTVDVGFERIQSLPAEAECELFQEEFEKFAAFASSCGVSALPATGHTVALYMIDLLFNGASLDAIADAVAGIKFAHEMARQYLDWAPIDAALEFAMQEKECKADD
jgi:hypothetical protein